MVEAVQLPNQIEPNTRLTKNFRNNLLFDTLHKDMVHECALQVAIIYCATIEQTL